MQWRKEGTNIEMKETADSQAEAKREEKGEENIVNPIALALY